MKIPKTIYIKEREGEKINEIAKKINAEREKENKKALKAAEIIHRILEIGINNFENKNLKEL